MSPLIVAMLLGLGLLVTLALAVAVRPYPRVRNGL
jgi:hypothetical protein